jgi:hypothetical protein
MSFFGRLRNLGRGLWITRGSDRSVPGEAALDAELRASQPVAVPSVPTSSESTSSDPVAGPDASGPEHDDKGKIVKTL